ncbi:hypothetical protein PC117_g22433 [Phytophthora cactorum]|uniref:Uncharacterized protein n=1 Tax=Phytophthora cactorum TaxID=29920 RepID=A0A8T1B8P4_9STRA|nr:hypothetical protein PC117_g22433 [Phytophthora cactorum]
MEEQAGNTSYLARWEEFGDETHNAKPKGELSWIDILKFSTASVELPFNDCVSFPKGRILRL